MPEKILEQLVVKREQLERRQKEMLVKMVIPFAAIEPESGRVHIKAPFDELNAKHKVLVYLLARLALSALPDAKLPKSTSPKEIEMGTGLSGGTVRPMLTKLVGERLVVKDDNGYYVSPAALTKASKDLEPFMSQGE